MHGHVALEFAGTDAEERDAVAMVRVHVRLNLENKTGEAGFSGAMSMPPITRDLGAGECFRKPSSKSWTPKLLHAAAEEHRRGFAREHGGIVQFVPGVFEHFEFLDRPAKGFVVELAANRRIVQSADLHRRAILAADGALEQMHQFRLPVIDALELQAVADGPVHRERADAEHALQFVEQRERIFHRAGRTCS